MDADVTFTLDSYDVVKEIYPADVDEYDGLLISGSRSSPSPYRHPLTPFRRRIRLRGRPVDQHASRIRRAHRRRQTVLEDIR